MKKSKRLIEPQREDLMQYAVDNGYPADLGSKVYDYYSEMDTVAYAKWVDSNGKKIKSWKKKMISVWFKPENKGGNNGHSDRQSVSKKVTGADIAAADLRSLF